MSDYVEARYAKLVLQEARLAKEDIASKLVNARTFARLGFSSRVARRSRAGNNIHTLARAQS